MIWIYLRLFQIALIIQIFSKFEKAENRRKRFCWVKVNRRDSFCWVLDAGLRFAWGTVCKRISYLLKKINPFLGMTFTNDEP